MADFVVHDQHGTILEPAEAEPNDHDHSRGVTKKVYHMFEDSGSSEDYEAKNDDRPKDRHLDFDDDEQFYQAQVGEIFHETFKVVAIMGKGVYGSLVKAQEISTDRMGFFKVCVRFKLDSEVCGCNNTSWIERDRGADEIK